MEFKVVERAKPTDEIKDEVITALIATKESGKAILVTLPAETVFVNWQSTVRNRLRKHDLRLRMNWYKAKREVIAWVEPLV